MVKLDRWDSSRDYDARGFRGSPYADGAELRVSAFANCRLDPTVYTVLDAQRSIVNIRYEDSNTNVFVP
jgi:hypothetical protein